MLPLFRFLIGFALVGSSLLVEASNFSKPHAHTGKVEPFTPGDPKIKLDGKATGILKAGKPYQVSRCVLFKHNRVFLFLMSFTTI